MSKIAKLVVVCGIPEEITYLGCIMYAIAKQRKHIHAIWTNSNSS